MSNVTYTLDDGIATIAMDDGKANVLSPTMLTDLSAAFDQAEADKAIVILTGRDGGVFSGGFDLKVMMSGPENAIALTCQGSRFAMRILSFPYPVIAAVGGHAIAMGAFTLLACDYRIGANADTKTGLNETAIGMPMHDFGIEIAREFISKTYLNRSMINGEIFAPDDAKLAGYYDKLVAKAEVMTTAVKTAKMMKLLNMRAFKSTKNKSRKALFNTLNIAIATDEKMTVME